MYDNALYCMPRKFCSNFIAHSLHKNGQDMECTIVDFREKWTGQEKMFAVKRIISFFCTRKYFDNIVFHNKYPG